MSSGKSRWADLLWVSGCLLATGLAGVAQGESLRVKKVGPRTSQIHGEDGRPLVTLNGLYAAHFHPLELCSGGQLFWIFRPERLEENWADELRLRDLQSGKERTIARSPGLVFAAPPHGRWVAVSLGGNTKPRADLIDLRAGRTTIYAGYHRLLGFSHDGHRLWVGKTDESGPWSELGLYERGKLKWLPFQEKPDATFQPNRGWLAYSDAEPCFDIGCGEDAPKTITVVDVLSNERVTLPPVKSANLGLRWKGERLRYRAGDRVHVIDPWSAKH